MYYGYYRNIRDNAWNCLIDFNVSSLPVDILGIAKASGIHVIKNSSVNDLLEGEHGKSYFNGEEWIIIYDDRDDVATARFTLAHELGHIFLGHDLIVTDDPEIKEFKKKPRSEQQSDTFALRLLCPVCVLNDLGIDSPERLAEYCKIPLDRANIRYKRLCELRKRNKFFTSELEKRLYENFRDFLENANTKK